MQERIGFGLGNVRKTFFVAVKNSRKVNSWEELRKIFKLPRTTFQNYQYGERLMPKELFESMLTALTEEKQSLFNNRIFTKPSNWGAVKGGQIGIRKMGQKYDKETVRKWCQKAGRNSVKNLRVWMNWDPEKVYLLLRRKKLNKSMTKLLENISKFEGLFNQREIKFDLSTVKLSKDDLKRSITIPQKLTPQLAEEIGIHLGDGTLSNKPNYFSVRGGFDEEKYYTDFVLQLYKNLYKIEPPLLKRSSACGFEISSKGIREFKNKILGLPIGTKTYRAKVPLCIMESRDRNIMHAFLRGLFDTDGCYYFNNKKRYPVISLCVKSEELINKVSEILILLGFSPSVCKKNYSIYLNGVPQFKKWIEQIGSNNPKHLGRIESIKQQLPWSSLEKLFAEESSS